MLLDVGALFSVEGLVDVEFAHVTVPPATFPPIVTDPDPPVTTPLEHCVCCAYTLKIDDPLNNNSIIEVIINGIFIVLINKASIINGLASDVVFIKASSDEFSNTYNKCICLVSLYEYVQWRVVC